MCRCVYVCVCECVCVCKEAWTHIHHVAGAADGEVPVTLGMRLRAPEWREEQMEVQEEVQTKAEVEEVEAVVGA